MTQSVIEAARRHAGVPDRIDVAAYDSLPALFEDVLQRFRHRPAFTGLSHTLTYGDLDRLSARLAAYFQHDLGLQAGERIAIQLPNTLQYPVLCLAALRAGLVIVNTNPLYTQREMEHQFRDAEVRAVVVLDHFADKLEAVLPNTAIEHVILTGIADLHPWPRRLLMHGVTRYVQRRVPRHGLTQAIRLRTALKRGRRRTRRPVSVSSETLAMLQYTGGTTGVAKGAMLSHGNLVANALQSDAIFRTYGFRDAAESLVLPLPLYHIYAFMLSLIVMHSGNHAELIADPRDEDSFVRALRGRRFSGFCGLNTMFVALCDHPGFRALDFSGLKMTISGGMALTQDAARVWERVTGCPVYEGYGLTETSPVVSVNPGGGNQPGTIGVVVPNTEVRVVDNQGRVLPAGEPGELCVRGPQVMQGYWRRPDDTRKAISEDGWFHTGDVAIIRDDGYLKIVDRMKDMILVSGFNVYPNEVEDVATRHPDVRECAAVGVPDDRSGEAVKLFVVARTPDLTAEAVRDWCRESLAAYKVPRHVEFRESLPRSSVGKILRRKLRDAETGASEAAVP